MKYGELNLGQVEAIVNKLGGMDGVRRFLSGETVVTGVSVPVFVHDKTKDDWTLLEHASRRITSATNLELVPFLKEKESFVSGEEMVRRARVELDANCGQEDAEWLLEHQDEIPAEFRKYYLVFTGTIWRGSRGNRIVPYLGWIGGRWCLGFPWLFNDWVSSGRLVRPRK